MMEKSLPFSEVAWRCRGYGLDIALQAPESGLGKFERNQFDPIARPCIDQEVGFCLLSETTNAVTLCRLSLDLFSVRTQEQTRSMRRLVDTRSAKSGEDF
jgi:hypothetical protein